jgi:hypothetical protein
MADRSCLACGESIEGTHPLRKFCDNGDVCKKRHHRGARATAPADDSPTKPTGVVAVAATTVEELAVMGKLGTSMGQAALKLAHRIDNSERDTGAGLSSMVNRLDQVMARLRAETPPEASPLDQARDELAERRKKRSA